MDTYTYIWLLIEQRDYNRVLDIDAATPIWSIVRDVLKDRARVRVYA